ncbi:hypothetical protein JHK87_024862 [Glycine soja]|nr:hypothetical protein JHK87_024862 [Glycine soja]
MVDAGDGNPPLGGDYMLLIDSITTQMETMMREHTEELYGRIEQLENQENNGRIEQLENQENNDDDGRRRRRRRDNDDGDAREDNIEGVKLNILPL